MNVAAPAPTPAVPAPRASHVAAPAAALAAPAPAKAPLDTDVIVVGAGVTGVATALDLARQGVNVHVVERRGPEASRRNLLNLAPAVGDKLHALDNGSGEITKVLVPIQSFTFDDRVAGEKRVRGGSEFSFEMNQNPGMGGLMDAVVSPPEDPRLWSRARLEEIENAMRGFAQKHYGDKITFHWNSQVDAVNGAKLTNGVASADPVGSIGGGTGAQAGIPAQERPEVLVKGDDGSEQAIRGAHLVFATGGRNALGIKPALDTDVAHFIGGEFPESSEVTANRVREWGSKIAGETDRRVNAEERPYTTIGLGYPKDNSILWAEVSKDVKSIPADEQKAILRERAQLVGMKGELRGEPIPVRVQLGGVDKAVDAERRIWLVGDELGPPYFPTSTGAARGIAAGAPQLSAALVRALKPGADVAAEMRAYEQAALKDHAALHAVSKKQLTHDLHETTRPAPLDLPREGRPGR